MRVRINNNNQIINGLRIIEMQNKGPLFDKGIKIDDIIVGINEESANWNNLISSLKFATLGESLKLDLIDQNGEFISINFDSLTDEVN
jgi:C-terminal processing protease CtpA/Prc